MSSARPISGQAEGLIGGVRAVEDRFRQPRIEVDGNMASEGNGASPRSSRGFTASRLPYLLAVHLLPQTGRQACSRGRGRGRVAPVLRIYGMVPPAACGRSPRCGATVLLLAYLRRASISDRRGCPAHPGSCGLLLANVGTHIICGGVGTGSEGDLRGSPEAPPARRLTPLDEILTGKPHDRSHPRPPQPRASRSRRADRGRAPPAAAGFPPRHPDGPGRGPPRRPAKSFTQPPPP